MATMNFYTEDEALDKVLGEKGAPLRNQYESDMNAFLIGEAIKKARQSKNLTQEELGALIGVKKSQVSRIGLHYSRILVFLQLCLRKALYKSLLVVAEASVPMPETGNYSIGIQISVSNSSGAVVSGSFR